MQRQSSRAKKKREKNGILCPFPAVVCLVHLVRGPSMCIGTPTPQQQQQEAEGSKPAAAASRSSSSVCVQQNRRSFHLENCEF